MDAYKELLKIVNNIAHGDYSDKIMELTSRDLPEDIRDLAEAVGMMMVKIEAREYQLSLMVEELKILNDQIKRNTVNTLSTIANILATRDEYTEGHAERVAGYAVKIAEYMQVNADTIEYIRIAGLLHDIGKIGFPDILFQPHSQKNPPELVREIMSHPQKGFDILKDLEYLGPSLEYVYCHHERPDGKGYPRKLRDEEIPLGAKIIAVADAYDAMITARPYQNPKSKEDVLNILRNLSGKKWDKDCVNAIIDVLGN